MTPQELKESIILSAMQGKLVAQIDSEEPSAALLDRIAAEQTIQIKTKKAKASKADAITEEDIPFDIPSTWSWVRFGNLVCYNMGKTPPRAESQWWGAGVPWVSIADMPESGHILETKESVTHEAIHDKFSERISKAGTLIMSFKLTVGRVSILDIDAVHNEAIISIYPYADENETIKKYLFAILPYVAQSGDSKNAIKGKTLNDTSISNLLIPLPPLEEQKRIVAKLEEILPLIDRYEAAWNKLEEFNKRFPVDMQKSILQLAIQGKLVEQRSEEGTGEELFQQIQTEKQALIKAGKIKKEKPLPEIAEDEIPFDIPDSWKWVRLSAVIDVRDGTHDTPGYLPSGYPLITGKDFYYGYFDLSKTQYISKEDYIAISQRSKVDPYDILFSMIGGNIGSMIMITPENYFEMAIKNVALFKQYIFNDILPKYLFYFLKAQVEQMKSSAKGGAQMFVSLKMLRDYMFPLPPLAEQKRIVTKLEEILPLCDRLK
jgi:type I restriction enzyme S subunit